MLGLLLVLPLLASACTTNVRPQRFCGTFCDIQDFVENNRAPGQCQPDTCIWAGITVGLFRGAATCQCGAGLSAGLSATGARLVWSCSSPEDYEQVFFGGIPFVFLSNDGVTIAASSVISGTTIFGFQTLPLTVDDTTPPTRPCQSGWTLKLWVEICADSGGPPSGFQMQLAAGSNDPMHPLVNFTPSNSNVMVTVNGDVHFSTLDDVRYTFNAAGDYIYMRTKKPDCTIHVRTTMTKGGSVLAATAIKDDLEQRVIELWWSGHDARDMVVNARNKGQDANIAIPLADGRSVEFGPFIIKKIGWSKTVLVRHTRWPDFELITHYGGRSSFSLKVPNSWRTEGLGGNKNGVKEDDLCYREKERDGCLSLDADSSQVHDFGLSWKANPHELLFEKWMTVMHRELKFQRLKITSEELQKASKFCLGDRSCAYDYIATGDEAFAKHTLRDSIASSWKNITYVGDELSL